MLTSLQANFPGLQENDFAYLFILCVLSAVIDIVRMVVLHPDGAALFLKYLESDNGICIKDGLLFLTVNFQIINLICLIICS